MKKIYLLLVSLALFFTLRSQTTLAAGDMAIIGVNRGATASCELAIVTLVNISSGTTIYISDYGYSLSSSSFITNAVVSEGAITWTVTSAISKGAIFLVKITGGAPPVVTGLPGSVSVAGWSTNSVSIPISTGGDNWFIYQGSSATVPTQFVYGFTNYVSTTFGSANGWLTSGQLISSNVTGSELPASLTNGTNARSLAWPVANSGKHGDFNVYTGIQSGTKAALLAAITNPANWTTNETTAYYLTSSSSYSAGITNSGNPYFTGASPSFTVTGSLPITLDYFRGNPSSSGFDLQWSTSLEQNANYIEVERSIDGKNFRSQARITAKGVPSRYSFTDALSDVNAKYFYRLRLVDIDGSSKFSPVIFLSRTGQGRGFEVNPNPATDIIRIQSTFTSATLNLYNLSGVLVKTQQWNAGTVISLSALPSGIYLLKLSDGKKSEQTYLIKQ